MFIFATSVAKSDASSASLSLLFFFLLLEAQRIWVLGLLGYDWKRDCGRVLGENR